MNQIREERLKLEKELNDIGFRRMELLAYVRALQERCNHDTVCTVEEEELYVSLNQLPKIERSTCVDCGRVVREARSRK